MANNVLVKKDDNMYCGTHDKNRPHGEICPLCEDEVKNRGIS